MWNNQKQQKSWFPYVELTNCVMCMTYLTNKFANGFQLYTYRVNVSWITHSFIFHSYSLFSLLLLKS